MQCEELQQILQIIFIANKLTIETIIWIFLIYNQLSSHFPRIYYILIMLIFYYFVFPYTQYGQEFQARSFAATILF